MTTAKLAPHNPQPRLVKVTRADLPLSCPRAGDELWNQHPRVFLKPEAVCPYCGTRYVLDA